MNKQHKNTLSKKLLYVVNVDWFFISHRLPIALKAVALGWDVTVLAGDSGKLTEIANKGISCVAFPISRSGTSVLREVHTLRFLYKTYKKISPDVVHHITLKPVLYGSVISRILNIKGTVNAISGLGYNFTSNRNSYVQKIMIALMRFGFQQQNLHVIFQNKDDYKELKKNKLLPEKACIHFIKGSGVALDIVKPIKKKAGSKVTILFPSRMLWDKGVQELREATELLRDTYQHTVSILLAGMADTENKAGVTSKYLLDWHDGEYVKWVGHQEDMNTWYQQADIVVLPSYREGMPKSLIEACAAGLAIVTTDAIGCKECVDEGDNGFKVPVKSVSSVSGCT